MINGYCRNGEVNEANELVIKMQESGCLPDGCLINIVIRGFLLQNEIRMAVEYLEILRKNGFSLDAYTESLLRNFRLCVQVEDPSKSVVERK